MKIKTFRLGELGKMIVGGDKPTVFSKDKTEDCPIPIFSNGLENDGLYGYTDKARVKDSCLTISARGTVGAVFFRKEPFLPIVRLIAFVPNLKLIDAKYLYYYLSISHLDGFGTSQQQITAPYLSRIKISIFEDIKYQHRIASILSAYDNLIENNNKRIRLLELMAENLYKEWFVRFRFPGHEKTEFENVLPKGWKIVCLSDYIDIIMGQSPESKYYNKEKEGLPFHQGVGSYGNFYLVDEVYATKGKKIAAPNSIIFSVRAPVGRLNITLNKIILGRGVASMNAKDKKNSFLFWMLKNIFSKEDIIGNGSIFTSVTKDELFKLKITLPSNDVRNEFDMIGDSIEKEIRSLSLNNENLSRQRDLLLPRLMSGKLEV